MAPVNDVINPRQIDTHKVEEFMGDLRSLQEAIQRPLSKLGILLGSHQRLRAGGEGTPIHYRFRDFQQELEELEARLNTTRKEIPKLLASLQVASQWPRRA